MKKDISNVSRRSFLGKVSLLVIGGSVLPFSSSAEELSLAKISDNKLWDEFSEKEKKLLEKSKRAQGIVAIEDKSCAETVLLSTIKSFRQPEKMLSMAASFGGGIKKGDLCGLLTGSFMSIGLAGSRLIKDEEERSAWVKEKTNEYWLWWEERAPRHCDDLKPLYSGDRTNYQRMIQRIALKLDEMFII